MRPLQLIALILMGMALGLAAFTITFAILERLK